MDRIILGDSLEVLKKLKANSVDVLVTDPPYGYSFMGKSWDKTLPDIGIFKECHRVLKPGAFAFVMSAPRSDVCARMMILLEDAGFNIGFTPIYWTYASGFPKASNIGKMVDKRAGVERKVVGTKRNPFTQTGSMENDYGEYKKQTGEDGYRLTEITAPATDQAKALEGSYGGFQPKPAVEVVIVAMKPLSEKTFVDQALKNGKGITWLDDCRVPYKPDDAEKALVKNLSFKNAKTEGGFDPKGSLIGDFNSNGRFPANLIVSDDVLNDGRSIKGGGAVRGAKAGFMGSEIGAEFSEGYADSGSYSRYFSLDSWSKTLPFLIVPKASKREKNEGLDALPKKRKIFNGQSEEPSKDIKDVEARMMTLPSANHHPTIKPLTLMSYLITLGSRPGDVVLDPFLGSGTTCLAAKQLGRQYIGIEREKEYVEIANARLKTVENALL